MPLQKIRRPGLQPAVESLLLTCTPVLRLGGTLPLTRVVEAIAGVGLKPEVLEALQARGEIVVEKRQDAAFFLNTGPQLKVPLRRFDLVVPPRISGQAVAENEGVTFRFDKTETLKATKFMVSVHLERLQVTWNRIVVNVQGGLFDQCIDLV